MHFVFLFQFANILKQSDFYYKWVLEMAPVLWSHD